MVRGGDMQGGQRGRAQRDVRADHMVVWRIGWLDSSAIDRFVRRSFYSQESTCPRFRLIGCPVLVDLTRRTHRYAS